MSRLSTPESTKQALLKAIINSHNKHGYSSLDWFTWMIDDCMAGFGKRLKNPWSEDQTKHLFELSGLYAESVIKNQFTDILGFIYMELASQYGKKRMGQYFTPSAVALCMAQISMLDCDSLFESKPVVRIQEPAAGSGVMILAVMQTIMEKNPAYLEKLSIYCQDLDWLCVKMSTLQVLANFFFHKADIGQLVALQGNSLGPIENMTTYFHSSTRKFADSERRYEQELADQKLKNDIPALPVISKTVVDFPPFKAKQLSLFDFTIQK